METTKALPAKLLILCVDRDDDIGQITNLKTPIIGRKNVLKAAIDFAIKCPEDSDSNALFAAVQLYDRMTKIIKNGNVEVAVVAGTPEEGVEADMKISMELSTVLSSFKAEGVILVSDGPTDEQVLPIIQSKVPVISVRRVIVQQSRGIEESFVLILRYLEKLVKEEKYRKYSLGLPGLLIILITIMSYTVPQYIWPLIITTLGGILSIKGFALDEKIKHLYAHSPIMFLSFIAGLALISIASALGVNTVINSNIESITEAIGWFLLATVGGQVYVVDLLVIAASLIIAGHIADNLMSNRASRWSEYVLLIFTILFRQVLVEVARLLKGAENIEAVIYWTVFSLMVAVLSASFFVTKKKLEISTGAREPIEENYEAEEK
ncbi:MAG: hypothetical protein B6U95_01810 [Thermofilum sp. ex4484_82]|nr:MAG: hypothetical protein B6U95_01810 [Thermofilum sp. ex4484_82]OYT39500.1 MAG: hypothetical protein B6U96_01815 [Archaeoglobales archaeon ex4484_92]